MAHTCTPSTWGAEAGQWLEVQGQSKQQSMLFILKGRGQKKKKKKKCRISECSGFHTEPDSDLIRSCG